MEKKLKRKIKFYHGVEDTIDWAVRILALIIICYVGFTMWHTMKPADKSVIYHEGDTWLWMEETQIDYPVMKGKDNFEWLEKNPKGEYYVGGSLFIDYRNKYDFSDDYSIIYGHNMAGPKMFGDLKKYFNKDFFDKHKRGILFTPEQNYELTVVGVVQVDAYHSQAFRLTSTPDDLNAMEAEATNWDGTLGDHIVALSTCSSTMDDNRDVVLCNMRETNVSYVEVTKD